MSQSRLNGWAKPLLSAVAALVLASIGGGIVVRDTARESVIRLEQVQQDLSDHESLPAHPEMDRTATKIQSTLDNIQMRLDRQDASIGKIDDKLDRLIDLQLRRSSRDTPPSVPREMR